MKIVYEISNEIAPVLVQAICEYNGEFRIDLPAYHPTLPDPNYKITINNEDGIQIPNPIEMVPVPNTISAAEYAQQFIINVCKKLMALKISKDADKLVIEAADKANEEHQVMREKYVASQLDSINTNVKVSLE